MVATIGPEERDLSRITFVTRQAIDLINSGLKLGITQDLYIYIDGANGSDSNDGLSTARPLKTIQAGVTLAGRYGVIVQGFGSPIQAGPFIYVVVQGGQTYNESIVFGRIDGAYAESSAYVIGSQVLVVNGGAGPQAANISLTGAPVIDSNGGVACFYTESQNWAIRGLKLQNSPVGPKGDCVFSDNTGFINVWEVEWGTTDGYHMIAQAGGRIVHYRDQIISGGAKGHRAVKQGGIIQGPAGQTETFSVANLPFTDAFEVGEGWGGIWTGTITYAGNSASVIGIKYRLDGTCVLDTRSAIGTVGGHQPAGSIAGVLSDNAVFK